MSASQISASEPSSLPLAGSDIFGQYGAAVTCASAVILILAISAIDKLTGFDLHLGVLNLIPIALVTWVAGRGWGIALGLAAVAIWLVVFRAHSSVPAYYWDSAVQLGIFVAFVELLTRLRDALACSNERLVKVLEELDAAVYVVDPRQGAVLYGNRHFRETLAQESYEALAQHGARECRMHWPDGRRVLLRIIADPH